MCAFPKIVDCPYMPEGFMALENPDGSFVVFNLKTGYGFKIPSISLLQPLPIKWEPKTI
jgi:hypothetical protein